jgi:hypothetical protein
MLRDYFGMSGALIRSLCISSLGMSVSESDDQSECKPFLLNRPVVWRPALQNSYAMRFPESLIWINFLS